MGTASSSAISALFSIKKFKFVESFEKSGEKNQNARFPQCFKKQGSQRENVFWRQQNNFTLTKKQISSTSILDCRRFLRFTDMAFLNPKTNYKR